MQARLICLGRVESRGCFALTQFAPTGAKTAAAANAFLQSQGIIVRPVGGYGLPNALRISIGNDEEMEAVLDAVDAFMGQS